MVPGKVAFDRFMSLNKADFLSEDHRGTPEAPGRVLTLIKRSFWETLEDPVGSFVELFLRN